MSEQLRRPEVTLVASSAPAGAPEQAEPPRLRPLLLAVVVLLGFAVLWVAGASPQPRPEVPADLVLLQEQLSITQGGVLVVPVELRNPGDALRVRSSGVYAEPVLDDPLVQAPVSVRPASQRRFVALLAPDCRLLQAGSPFGFSASLLLKVGRGSTSQDLVLDLASAPVVREAVTRLCRGA